MARNPTQLQNGNIRWEETIEQPDGRNVFAESVEVISAGGSTPSDTTPPWLSFENLSTTLSGSTIVRPVQITVDPDPLSFGVTYIFEITATNGVSTSSYQVGLEVLSDSPFGGASDYEIYYERRFDDTVVFNDFTFALPNTGSVDNTSLPSLSFTNFDFGSNTLTKASTLSVTADVSATGVGVYDVSTDYGSVTAIQDNYQGFHDVDGSFTISSLTSSYTGTDTGFASTSVEAGPRNIIIPNIDSLDWDGSAVTIEWTATDPDISHYNVYRSTSPSSGFTEISGSNITSQSYTDSTVSEDTTYYYQVSSVDGSSNESETSFSAEIITSADVFIEGFEDDDSLDKWTVDAGQIGETFQPAYGGRRAAGIRDDFASSLQLRKELNGPRRPDRFRFRYWETSDSTGGGFQLRNGDGQTEVQVATDNPEWDFVNADGTTTEVFDGQQGGSPVYEEWHEVRIKFDWVNGEYDYEWIRISDGQTVTGTRNLERGKSIQAIEFRNYNGGFAGADSTGLHMNIDDIALTEDVNPSSIATIQINKSLVDTQSAASDFPVYVDLSDFDDEWWTASTGASSIQVFDDTGTEVPREVVTYDSGNQEGEVWFKANTLETASDTKFDIEGAGSFTGTPANVWTDYEAVWHLHEDPSNASPQYIDATGNGYDAAAVNSPIQAQGLTGGAAEFDDSGDRINVASPTGLNLGTSDFTIQAVVNLDNIPANVRGIAGKFPDGTTVGPHYAIKTDGTESFRFEVEDGDGTNRNLSFSVSDQLSGDAPWYRLAGVRSGTSSTEFFSDGILQDGVDTSGLDSLDNTSDFNIGKFGNNGAVDGVIDEVRVANVARSSDWLRTEHWNTDQPSSWYTVIY